MAAPGRALAYFHAGLPNMYLAVKRCLYYSKSHPEAANNSIFIGQWCMRCWCRARQSRVPQQCAACAKY
jgi:hypothetical protein